MLRRYFLEGVLGNKVHVMYVDAYSDAERKEAAYAKHEYNFEGHGNVVPHVLFIPVQKEYFTVRLRRLGDWTRFA